MKEKWRRCSSTTEKGICGREPAEFFDVTGTGLPGPYVCRCSLHPILPGSFLDNIRISKEEAEVLEVLWT